MTFTLAPRAPFRLDWTAWALRRRDRNAVDGWDGAAYRRVLVWGGAPEAVEVTQAAADPPVLRVRAGRARAGVSAALERMLGLQADLSGFYALARQHPRLEELAARFRGMKPPRFPSLFEALANAITCQKLSLTVGITILNRLAARYGLSGAFPRPEEIAAASPEEMRPLGYSRQKAAALIGIARALLDGSLDERRLERMDNAEGLAELLALRGVGRWTAEYVLLRGLGRIDVFPGDDVGVRNNLQRWLGRREPMDYAAVERALRPFRPYGGLIYFHMLLDAITAQAGRSRGRGNFEVM